MNNIKRLRQSIIIILGAILLLGVFISCNAPKTIPEQDKIHVLVIHEFADVMENNGDENHKVYDRIKKQSGLDDKVSFHHYYLNEANEIFTTEALLKSEKEKGHLPSYIICHKDQALLSLVGMSEETREMIKDIPIIYTAVCHPQPMVEALKKEGLIHITGYRHNVDFEKNLQFYQQLSGENQCAVLMSDINGKSREIYLKLNEFLNRNTNKYINNLDNHLSGIYDQTEKQLDFGDRIVVSLLSFANPEKGNSNIEQIMKSALINSDRFWQIEVEYELGNNIIIENSNLPQLSVINTQFNSSKTRILGGYFPSIETEITDALSTLQRLINGEIAEDIEPGENQPKYWLDYNAMVQRGIDYDQWKYSANILNAPLKLRDPIWWFIQNFVFWLIAICISAWIIYKIQSFSFTNKYQKAKEEREKQLLWIQASDNVILWKLERGTIEFKTNVSIHDSLKNKRVPINKFLEFVHPDQMEELKKLFHYEFKEGTHRISAKMRLDGNTDFKWWLVIVNVGEFDLVNNQMAGRFVNINDVHEEMIELENQLQLAEETKLKESFLANLSHDIRNPLSSIVGFSELMTNEDQYSEEERKEFIGIIRTNTEIMLKLIDDVAYVSKLQIGQYRFQLNNVKVSSIIDAAFTANSVIPHISVDFIKQPGNYDAFIKVDFERTLQVLNNYLSNAFKYTASGTVAIGWKNYPERVELYVQDTGSGMDQDKQLHVFEQYYLGDEQHHGTGLGLYIVKMMVEQQGGYVGVESHVGVGSRFYASFPVIKSIKKMNAK